MSNVKMDRYGYTDFFKVQSEMFGIGDKGLIPARVIEVQREYYTIITEFGEKGARLKGSLFYNGEQNVVYPAVGDFVFVQNNPYGQDIIYKVLDRKSKFSRLDSFNETEQVVATNFDYVFIMTSLNHDLNLKRLERYLATAWQSGGMPVIVLTKLDLCPNYEEYKAKVESMAVGVPVVAISSLTGEGMEELKKYIKPATTIVFLGSSGVGKSSLVNTIAGCEIMKVSGIREDDSKGRHTTTHRQLIMLDNGTMIIDTPGMRELGLWDVTEGISTTFSDIEDLATRCKFRDCSHGSEPGCAVKEALEKGELSKDRWQNFIKLKKEAEFAERKENTSLRMKEKAFQKGLSKFQKSLKKGRR
ncbi:ribosome small subunit-dependent GTPase A [Clostridium thermarum]|uniref:ribosome small subunit-dependent GTPase A n=1 Tax=Clostridium thermarum TaxID=1716543 RepID=UPI001124CA3B|nr:ribosome small subunit-dependent GTPase A [Clostridium thermarum]